MSCVLRLRDVCCGFFLTMFGLLRCAVFVCRNKDQFLWCLWNLPFKVELRRETYLMRLPVQKCSKKRTLCCLLLKSDWLGCDGEHASNLHIWLSLHCHFQTIISNMFFVDNFTRSVWPFLDIWWDADVFGITFWPAREYADVHAWLIDDRYKPSKTKAWQPHYWLSEMTIWIESRDVFGTYSFFIAFNATSSSWKSHQRVPFSKAFFCPKKPIVQIILGIVQCRNSPKSWSGSVRVSTHLGGLQHGETPEAKASCFVFKKIRVDQYW